MIKHKCFQGWVHKKPVLFLLFFLSFLPVSGSGFDIPCLPWFPEPQTRIPASATPGPEAEQEVLLEVVLPVTTGELQAIYGHQVGLLLISLLPVVDLYFGLASLPEARRFGQYLYLGLYLERLFQQKTYLSRAAFNLMFETMGEEYFNPQSLAFYQKSGLSTDTSLHSIARPVKTSLYIKTATDRDEFFSEADQMIDYANQLFKPGQNSQEMVYSRDNLAFITPSLVSGEYEIFQLSVTNPDNATHVYDIAHKNGCNWLLGRDGTDLDNYLAASWKQGEKAALSLSPASSPAPLARRKLSLHIPRAFIGMGLTQVSSWAVSLSGDMPDSFYGSVTKVVISAEPGSGHGKAGLLPGKIAGSLNPEPDWLDQTAVQPQWPLSPRVASLQFPGMVQLMDHPVETGFHFRAPASGNGENGQPPRQQEERERKDDGSENGSGDGNGGRGASPSSSGSQASSEGEFSLIERVARDRLIYFSSRTTSTCRKKVNVPFIKSLSRAGLAQVIVDENLPCTDGPLVISKTLVRYLVDHWSAAGLTERRDRLQPKLLQSNYYVELDQELYDDMLEYYQDIKQFASLRTDIFMAYRKMLIDVVNALNCSDFGYRFVLIGGEGLSSQVAKLNNENPMRGNFPIRDDLDVLMQKGSIEMIRSTVSHVLDYPVVFPSSNFMGFSFPCLNGPCFFNVYRLQLHSPWGNFLPTLDISFPADELNPPHLPHSEGTLVKSLSRALQFKEDKQKYLDRTLFLRHLLPENLGVQFLYLNEFVRPSMSRNIQRLHDDIEQGVKLRQKLEARVAAQQKELGEHMQAMETLRQASEKGQGQLRHQFEMELSNRMETLIAKHRKQTEDHSETLSRLQEEKTELTRQLDDKAAIASRLMANLERRNSRFQQLENELSGNRKKQAKLELLLQEAQSELRKKASDPDRSEEVEALKNENAGLQNELSEVKEDNEKKKARLAVFKTITHTAKTKFTEQKEEIEALKSEQERHTQEYLAIEKQLAESHNRIASLESELAEAKTLQAQMVQRDENYQKNKKDSKIKLQQLEGHLEQSTRDNEQLRKDVRWYRHERKLQLAASMIPVALFAMREFLVPIFHDQAKATCAPFRHEITYQYCVRNWVSDQRILWALEAFDQLSGDTRIVLFDEEQIFKPGYRLVYQEADTEFNMSNYLFQLKEMRLYLPGDFIPLENLTIAELDQSLDAFSTIPNNQDSAEQVMQGATTYLLLCGIMPDRERQNRCAKVIARIMEKQQGRWPCWMHNFTDLQDSICKRFIMPGLTRKLSRKKLLALLPSWSVPSDGELEWYDLWPVQLNKYGIDKNLPGGNCTRSVELSKYCDSGRLRVWKFNNYWGLEPYLCDGFSASNIGIPKAFWLQSWSGEINDVIACDGKEFMEAVWQ